MNFPSAWAKLKQTAVNKGWINEQVAETEKIKKKQPAVRQWMQTNENLHDGHSDRATAAQGIGQSLAYRTAQLQLQHRCCSWY
jgi:hypothetical protein